MVDLTWIDDLTPEDLTTARAKAPYTPKGFKEMTPRVYGYHLATPAAPRDLPRGGAIESVIKENHELKAREWAIAHKAIEAADRKRLGAEYRAQFMLNLLTA